MPYFCSAVGCHNNSSSKKCQESNITFHSFPLKNEVLLKFWLIQMKRSDFVPDSSSWLCSEHFDGDCFYYKTNSGRRMIQPDAVPTKFTFTKVGGSDQTGTCTVPTVLHIVRKRKLSESNSESFLESPSELLLSSSSSQDAATQTSTSGNSSQYQLSLNRTYRPIKTVITCKDAEVQTKMDGISALLIENTVLQNELAELKLRVNRLTFSVEAITEDSLMKSLTGFSIHLFKAIFTFLDVEKELSTYAHLSPLNQFFAFLIYLRTGISQLFVSILFKISQASVSRLMNHVSHFIYTKVKAINIWPSRHRIRKKSSPVFFRSYPNCRVILECVELQIQRPTSHKTQRLTFSTKKNTYTVKGLVGKTPSGAISFISDIWPGSISDKDLFLKSGILDYLEEYDLVVADRCFNIKEELEMKECSLTTPKFLTDKIMLTSDELEVYPEATHHRVHYDLATSKFNKFKFFEGQISTLTFDVVNEYFYVVGFLINFGNPLIYVKQH